MIFAAVALMFAVVSCGKKTTEEVVATDSLEVVEADTTAVVEVDSSATDAAVL